MRTFQSRLKLFENPTSNDICRFAFKCYDNKLHTWIVFWTHFFVFQKMFTNSSVSNLRFSCAERTIHEHFVFNVSVIRMVQYYLVTVVVLISMKNWQNIVDICLSTMLYYTYFFSICSFHSRPFYQKLNARVTKIVAVWKIEINCVSKSVGKKHVSNMVHGAIK